MHQHHTAQVDELSHLHELGQLLIQAVENDDKAAFDQLNIGAIGSGATSSDAIEQLVWSHVHPSCSDAAKIRLLQWRLGGADAVTSWVEAGFVQIAAILLEHGHQPGASWSRSIGPLLLLTAPAMAALEMHLSEGLEPGTDPLALVRPWLLQCRAGAAADH